MTRYGVDVSQPFPPDTKLYASFNEFEDRYFDFCKGVNLAENRALFLKTDYSILADILGIKIGSGPAKDKPQTVSGEPVEAYARMLMDVILRFRAVDKLSGPTSFKFHVDRISLSNSTNENKDSAFRPVCCFCGGILKFFIQTIYQLLLIMNW